MYYMYGHTYMYAHNMYKYRWSKSYATCNYKVNDIYECEAITAEIFVLLYFWIILSAVHIHTWTHMPGQFMHEYITCPHRVALVILFINMCPHLLHFTLYPPLLTSPLSLPASSPFPTLYPFPFSLPILSPSLSPLSPSVSFLSCLPFGWLSLCRFTVWCGYE